MRGRRLLLILVVWAVFAERGVAGWVSNGGEESRDQRNIWFLDEAAPAAAVPIVYCVTIASGFGLEAWQVGRIVAEAWRDWREFFNRYGSFQATFAGPYGFPDGRRRRLALDVHEVPTCDSARTDQIEFLFGASNPRVDEFLHGDGEYALGLALRRPFDHGTFRTGGYVWIGALAARDAARLKHVVLHELGHVFGMPHDSTWVMDAQVADLVLRPDLPTRLLWDLGKIETTAWFFRVTSGRELDFTYGNSGPSGVPAGFLPNRHVPAGLARRWGLSDDGAVRIKVRTEQRSGAEPNPAATLLVDESVGGLITTQTFDGELHLTAPGLDGDDGSPGIFTEWLSANGRRVAGRVGIGFKWGASMPASGFFTLPGPGGEPSTKLAATLISKGSPALALFLPETGEWWEVKSP